MKLSKILYFSGIVTLLVSVAASRVFALPASEVEIVYFSDAYFTAEVGYVFRSCQGGVYREGRQTRYRVSSATPCNGSHPIEVMCYVDGRLTMCPANICESGLFECR